MKAILICSGGMDSVTLAYYLHSQRWELDLLTFDYGQRHITEANFANQCAVDLEAGFDLLDISGVGRHLTSSLTDNNIPVPDGHYAEQSMKITVVPNRNAIMLSIAFGIAAARNCHAVAIANHAGDHFIYPDCRPAFIHSFQAMQREAFGNMWDVNLIAPFTTLPKAEIVRLGKRLHVPFDRTWSCYKGGKIHCGTCGTCTERKEAFQLAGVFDPTKYAN